jgi:hypothetical protein
MTPERFIARQRLGKQIPAEANERNNRRAVFSVVSVALIATQRCSKLISAAVIQHATIEEAVFSVGPAPRLHNEDLTHLRELRESPDLAVFRIIEKTSLCAAVTVRLL